MDTSSFSESRRNAPLRGTFSRHGNGAEPPQRRRLSVSALALLVAVMEQPCTAARVCALFGMSRRHLYATLREVQDARLAILTPPEDSGPGRKFSTQILRLTPQGYAAVMAELACLLFGSQSAAGPAQVSAQDRNPTERVSLRAVRSTKSPRR